MTYISSNSASAATSSSSAQGASSDPLQAMNGEKFMLLLLAQLRNQNPLEPLQDKDMMAQFTQLNSLQELQKISASLQGGEGAGELTQAAGLIGKTVTFLGEEGELLSGAVSGVSMVENQVLLWVGDYNVPLKAVLSVSQGGE